MPKIRVLIVDASVRGRKGVADLLEGNGVFEVVGTASSGRLGRVRIPQLAPDVVTLDVDIPGEDALENLNEIRRAYPGLPVVLLGSREARGARSSRNLLGVEGTRFLVEDADLTAPPEQVRDELGKVLADAIIGLVRLSDRTLVASAASGPGARQAGDRNPPLGSLPSSAAPHARPIPRIGIVVFGSSTGGPEALATLVPSLRPDLNAPVVIVQHMPAEFTPGLAARLDALSRLSVVEARDGERIEPGYVYVAAGDRHLELRRAPDGVDLVLHQGPRENSMRPSVDVTARSAVRAFGRGTLVVVLTGMGRDGLRGAKWVREAGGQVVVQDEATSLVWGMPRAIADAGLADAVLPLGAIADEVCRRVAPPVTAESVPSAR